MASQWRIRHKLMLGLVLVVGIMALLLGGTLRGLWSYYMTMNGIKAATNELKHAEDLKATITNLRLLLLPDEPLQGQALLDLSEAVDNTRRQVNDCAGALEETKRLGYYDPDRINDRQSFIDHISADLAKLKKAIEDIPSKTRGEVGQNTTTEGDWKKNLTEPRKEVANLEVHYNELSTNIHEDLANNFNGSKKNYQNAIWIITPASVGGLLLVCGLMRACYAWVVKPLAELEHGVIRVAQGDFEHRIKLNSGDEMQDLAEAFNDMTQRLQTLYNDLARQVNERSRQLVRSEKLASVGFLAAGVAHEINNPLASIAFCSEALEARLQSLLRLLPTSTHKGDDLEVFLRYLKMIQQEAFRCKTITEKLLDFSRTGERRREPTDLAHLIQSVLDITQHLPNSKGKQIVFESQFDRVPGGRITAPVNAEEIKSVVLNLVVNALDSMDDGGKLTILLSQRDGMAQMQFHDTGCGMAQEVLENIFEPFFTRSRNGKGTGLGLTISHRIINQHGGEIEAASPGPNQGSTFTVRLPVLMAETVPPVEPRGTPRSLAA